jgi:hypothetical protein
MARVKTKDCCAMMSLVLSRPRDTDRLGLMRELMFSIKGGPEREAVVLRFRPAPRGDKGEFARATYGEVRFCPFCGAKRDREVSARKRGSGNA